ncbi:MAG: RAQPRD family integrative conjugative element protein [Candidatus Thiodiazotropha endolucinida]
MLLAITRLHTFRNVFLGLFIAITSSPIYAGELETAKLALLTTEINYLIDRVEEIRDTSNHLPVQRMTFRYQDLINDLEIIKHGITDFIKADLRDGRTIKPLNGRYR